MRRVERREKEEGRRKKEKAEKSGCEWLKHTGEAGEDAEDHIYSNKDGLPDRRRDDPDGTRRDRQYPVAPL
jgi:hypothetical protein